MSSDSNDSRIQQVTLKGHRAPVLCLDHSSSVNTTTANRATPPAPSCLLSGSEDGTARLWDLRSSKRAALCIVAPRPADAGATSPEVTSVAFHPLGYSGEMAGVGGAYARDFTVYLSVGSGVYGYDLRNATSPIIRVHDQALSNVLESEDEVNQIAFSPVGKGSNRKVHLAAADDLGDVRVTDAVPSRLSAREGNDGMGSGRRDETKSDSGQPGQRETGGGRCRVLQHAEDGAAMAMCAAFRPRAKGLDLASGGTDCAVRLWDVTRPRRPSSSIQVQSDDEGAAQVCNPPMVFSLCWSPSGRLLVAGLGDGTATVLRVDGRTLTEVWRLRGGHDFSVASVLFPKFGAESSSHVSANDRLLISAGSDGAIILWDLGAEVAGGGAVDPSSWLQGCEASEVRDANLDDGSAIAGLSLQGSDPKILFGIPHGKKPNWLTSTSSLESAFPSSLFVADTSSDITAYMLPRR